MKNRFLTPIVCGAALALLSPSSSFADDAFNNQMDSYLKDEKNVEKIGTALENYFRKKQMEEQQNAAKRQAQEMEEQFKNPVKISAPNAPSIGPKTAKVTVIEFSDFQCPYCSRAKKVMDDLKKEYPNDVQLKFVNLPLPFHSDAKPAAIAALAAHRQGKFWEYHDILFENQRALKEPNLIDYAKKLGLDVDKFKKDMQDPAIAKQVEEDAALAAKHGVQGTPGFFVNGVQVRGARDLPYFKMLVDRWLKQGK